MASGSGEQLVQSGFKEKTIEEILKSAFKEPAKTKLNNESVKLTTGRSRGSI
jgi:hypothetical protein